MKQTVLHQKHLDLSARMTEFQGWQVPQQYTDVQDEYHAVRSTAGLFDISFLGRIEVTGPDAPSLLQKLFTRNISKIRDRTAHYGMFCNESGFILDDALLFRLPQAGGSRFLVTSNALNTDKIVNWIRRNSSAGVRVTDLTREIAQVALQGPQAPSVLERFLGPLFKKFKPRTVREIAHPEMTLLISRTGYTGEHGYEFFVPAGSAAQLWDSILDAGKELGTVPCGLASRDILRLETGFRLYGNDINENTTPLEAGLARFLDLQKTFVGSEALLRLKASGTIRNLAGFVLQDKSIPRAGGSIFSENREIGEVTSGGLSPALHRGIGLGYVITRYSQSGQEIEIEVRDREIVANIVEIPFYRK